MKVIQKLIKFYQISEVKFSTGFFLVLLILSIFGTYQQNTELDDSEISEDGIVHANEINKIDEINKINNINEVNKINNINKMNQINNPKLSQLTVSKVGNKPSQYNTLSITPNDLNAALDNDALNLTTGGGGNWVLTTAEFQNDGDSATLTGIDYNDNPGWIKTNVNGSGILSLYWKLSGSLPNYLYIYVDGISRLFEGGVHNWTYFEYNIKGPGSHNIEIRFDPFWSSAQAWVDHIVWVPDADSLEITSPLVNQEFAKNEQYEITWNTNGTIQFVKIDLYLNSIFLETIIANTTNDESYFWTLSTYITSNQYTIRISDVNNVGLFDEITFSIATPSINITYPTESLKLEVGRSVKILWVTSGNNYVIIQLFKGGVFLENITQYGNTGDHYWFPSSLAFDTDYQLKLIYSTNITITTLSANFELIALRTITVTAPTSSAEFGFGSSVEITWDWTSQVENVKIDLYDSSTFKNTIVASTTNTGSYSWTVPSNSSYSTNYRFRVSYDVLSIVYDYSDYFTISPPVAVLNPTSSDIWLNGSLHEITWAWFGSFTNVKIDLFKANVYVSTIISSTLNNGSYFWNIPSTLIDGNDYNITIYDSTNADINGSSSNFRIYVPYNIHDAIDNFEVNYQNGPNVWFGDTSTYYSDSDSLQSGNISHSQTSSFSIFVNSSGWLSWYWKVSSQANFDFLRFYLDGNLLYQISGEVDWTVIDFYISSGGNHVFTWVYEKDSGVISGQDAGWIDKITWQEPGEGIVMIEPLSSSVYYQGTSQVIAWNYNGTFTNVDIELYIDTTFVLTITSNYENNKSLIWDIPINLQGHSQYRIKITNSINSSTSDYSDYFTIPDYISPSEAVENAYIIIDAGEWFGQNITSFNGDAMQSNYIGTNSQTSFYVYVNNTGWLSFYWWVSALTGDNLNIYIDGIYQAAASRTDWEYKLYFIEGLGTHIIEFRYSKNHIGVSGLDAGLVDQIDWVLPPDELNVSTPILDDEYFVDEEYTFTWVYNGTIPLVKVELYNQTNLILTINPSINNNGSMKWTIPSSLETSSYYRIKLISLNNASVFDFSDYFTIYSYMSPNEAIDNNYLEITTDWKGQNGTSHDGDDALITPAIGTSDIEILEIEVYGKGNFSFYYLSTGARYNIYKDGIASIIGNTVDQWFFFSTSFDTDEAHIIKIVFYLAFNDFAEGTHGYIDEVIWEFELPAIQVINPLGSEILYNNENYEITWQSTGKIDFVNISLYLDDIFVLMISSNEINDGSFLWSISSELIESAGYKISITDSSNSNISNDSSSFSINEEDKSSITSTTIPTSSAKSTEGSTSSTTSDSDNLSDDNSDNQSTTEEGIIIIMIVLLSGFIGMIMIRRRFFT